MLIFQLLAVDYSSTWRVYASHGYNRANNIIINYQYIYLYVLANLYGQIGLDEPL